MKKNILLILLIILLTGCKANYNLKIDETGFHEKLTLTSENDSDNQLIKEYPIPVFYDAEGNNEEPMKKEKDVKYYKSSLKDNNGLNILTYSYTFNENNVLSSRIINNAFEKTYLKPHDYDENGTNDYLLISTTNDFSGFDYENLTEATVTIENNYKVISSNADLVKGRKYTWYFTKDNIKEINMVYDPNVLEVSKKNKLLRKNTILTFMIEFLVVSIVILIIIVLRGYSKYKDEI